MHGIDDFKDYWHALPGNLEKIRRFVEEFDIELATGDGDRLATRKGEFDVLLLLEVLEHLQVSSRNLMNELMSVVSERGLEIISVPNAVNIRKRIDVMFGRSNLPKFGSFYWYPGQFRGHIRKYVGDDLVKLTCYSDLELLELIGCDHQLHHLPPITRRANKFVRYLAPGLKDTWMLVERKIPGWSSKKAISNSEREQILKNYMPVHC